MYTEDYENRGFPFRDFLLKLILIIIFVLLLAWLLPKFIAPKIVENVNENATTINKNEISALSSQIFNDNINMMKEAAINYYTDERLPKESGKSSKMTLEDMIEKKIITPLTDKNNKDCDVKASYVKITKEDDEYVLKVNLKDSEREDYILTHLGHYEYCKNSICEKEKTDIIIKEEKPQTSPDESNNSSSENSNPSTNQNSQPSEQPKYLYKYQKRTGLEFSKWTDWSEWTETSCDTKAIYCSDTNPSCLSKQVVYSKKVQNGTYQKKYTTSYKDIVQMGASTKKACSNYNYVIVNSKLYITTDYTSVNTITNTTASTRGEWIYSVRETYSTPPTPNATTKYVFVATDFSNCGTTCDSNIRYIYDKYLYVGQMIEVKNTTSSLDNETISCGEYITKEIPIYSLITKTNIATRQEPLQNNICYKSTSTRTLINSGTLEYKWSKYGDTNLLNNGWTYTGERKQTN